jgi:hypothetical protein
VGLAAVLVFAAIPWAQAVICESDALSLLQENDGDVGMYLKRVNGPVLDGFNQSAVFEPASAIKVLVLTHALRQVQAGALTLSTMIPWTRDLNEDVCGSHPCNVTMPQAESDSLGLLLNQMMVCSDNRHTHALRTYFGDANILQTADDLGMTDTDFNHIIGCPDCDNLNEITLVDLGRLYSAVLNGFLDEERQADFHDLMINETFGLGGIATVIDEEVAKAGKPAQVATDFKALVRYAFKGGSYKFGTGCTADEDTVFRSTAGYVELPINNGSASCAYVTGAWINNAPFEVQTPGAVRNELLRLAVCEVLQTWDVVAVDEIVDSFDPPNPWVQEGIVINTIKFAAGTDAYDLHFVADPLQCPDVPCETNHHKKIASSFIEFAPREVPYVAAGDTVEVEVKITVPIGQHGCNYTGTIHAIADVEGLCVPSISEDIDVSLDVLPSVDVDIDDNHGNVSDNVLYLKGAKNTAVVGTFTVVNPNSWVQNVDFEDGPGNIRIEPVDLNKTGLVKIGDPAVVIPSSAIAIEALPSLGSGEAADITVTIDIPDGLPVNAFYQGTISVEYEGCVLGGSDSDHLTLQLEVLPTQGTLDIVQTGIAGDFCPDDPWTMVGQVALSFDVHAYGDHRNIRVASGGLRHETMPKKLDEFNFFPEEIAYLAAGETRTINVITKIPIGQHSGEYADYFRVVSENGGEDSVLATIDICELYDMDVKDDYANLSGNVMEIQAFSRGNASGGEWAVRAFDMGLPAELIGNHDEFDGPGNTPVDCIRCTFAEWSPMWHEDDPAHNLHSNFFFTGYGTVMGDSCDWGSGEFRRMLIGLFVPPMTSMENHPGTYKGRLDCYAVAGDDTVSSDSFDIEMNLARVVGPPLGDKPSATFVGEPTLDGAALYWGDFRSVGISGSVNLYRRDPTTGLYVRLNTTPLPQNSRYLDAVAPGEVATYRLGVWRGDEEVMLGPLSIGGNPLAFRLAQNAPNPFGERTTIAYDLPRDGRVSLRVFDVNGRLVRVLKDATEPAGFYTVTWDRRDAAGREAGNGIYFYRLDTPGFSATKKMLVLR